MVTQRHKGKVAENELEIFSQKMLIKDPNNSVWLGNLGIIKMKQRKFSEAIDLFRRSIINGQSSDKLKQYFANAFSFRAKQLVDRGDYESAVLVLHEAILQFPDKIEYLCDLSLVYSQIEAYPQALAVAEEAIRKDKAEANPYDVKGLALSGMGNNKLALKMFDKAINLNSRLISALNNKANVLEKMGESCQAENLLNQAIKLDPEAVDAYNNLGLILANRLQVSEAENNFRRAIEINPKFSEAHFNLSRILLMVGKYEEGWEENEWRWECKAFPSTKRIFPYPLWKGEDLNGKALLIWSEQGVGDQIMFANPIPDILRDGAKVILECDKRLVPIFSNSFASAIVTGRKDPPDAIIGQQAIDYQIPIASICKYYRNKHTAFPSANDGYLKVKDERKHRILSRYKKIGNRPFVGICWRSGNPKVGADRSMELKWWDGVLSQTKCTFVSLQYGEVDEEIALLRSRLRVHLYQDKEINPLTDAESWFAQVALMDLVISVDNSTIQVSGSQGVPTWTLLNYAPEWRFGLEGSDHDWHPSVRVYRQPSKGDWMSVLEAVSKDFDCWISKNG